MIKEFETLKDMCNFVLAQAKNNDCNYEIGTNEDGETCLYQKVLIGKVKDNAEK